jgi:alkanesulfonate monooxygenase SsuD/methylene tetrahydromethanopterin reductase-like flavin-dependent oxidoreductase (luciferase family)
MNCATPTKGFVILVLQLGIDSFAAAYDDASLAVAPSERVNHLIEQIVQAEQVGLDVFGIGEHHKQDYLDSAPALILAAAAARTSKIRLTSAVTVLSAADPVRVFQQFATLDLISRGRAEMVVGRGSSIEAFPLFGYDLNDYDALFAEKLELLLRIREQEQVHWSGEFRPALTGQGVYPRPVQNPLPIWLGVGGTPASFVRAGVLGTAVDGRDHRGPDAAVPPARRSLPRSRGESGAFTRSAHGRRPFARICRPQRTASRG